MVACTPDFDTKSILVVPNSTNTISITTPPLICDPSCLTPESLLTATPLVAVGSVQNVAPDLPRVPDNTPVDALALGSVPNYNLDSFDSHFIDKLLNSSLVDSAVEDPSNWESLFPDSNKAVATTSAISPLSRPLSTVSELVTDVLPTTITEEMVLSPVTHPVFETKFVHEKRSAMVLAGKEKKNEEDDDDEEDDEDLERRSKKRHISALEFEELASISLDSGSSPSKELPPIVVDPSDRRAVKRARNTMAARRSREKKKMEMDDLRQKVSDQERVIMKLEAQVNLLRTLLNQK
ncbi:uncharacterized protein SAPINGB_P001652 [Magnusiomyces paraingens]|uniref:BZIP domain-containing protein n=1 Tax=Magnusiomyces paraingens TaxID=2606893 RepID=A0A5E8B6T6_9ASCO|nr:uncharacterized protein SAPINGB_P001652 [Saprochaete ingens]VVT47319.1 unnamed protein product [Saprochaete ingens]